MQRDSDLSETILTENMLASQQGIYIKLLKEEQCIQIGDSADDDKEFLVNIVFTQVQGLKPVNKYPTTLKIKQICLQIFFLIVSIRYVHYSCKLLSSSLYFVWKLCGRSNFRITIWGTFYSRKDWHKISFVI